MTDRPEPGELEQQVAVLVDEAWATHFRGDARVIGPRIIAIVREAVAKEIEAQVGNWAVYSDRIAALRAAADIARGTR